MLREQILDVGGRRSRILRGGKANAPAAIFIHGGIPGVTPFCSGAHIWGDTLDAFAATRDVIALDLPGSGGTALGSDPLTVDVIGRHVLGVLSALSVSSVDVVGHDLGGLIGLWLALEEPGKLRGLSIVASPVSAPSGDGLDNLLLVSPPQPLYSHESQDWALDRLSYSHAHVTATLLDACVAAGEGEPHRAAAGMMKEHYARTFMPSVNRTKYRLWEACRNDGVRVPVQLVWASHDPASSREAGFALFNAIAPRQPAAQFHLINRAGSFPFREQPESFHHVVAAFQEGVWSEPRPAAA
jgi:2-hydroxy-6-oxonona-2,4-dienedioate hydrolase